MQKDIQPNSWAAWMMGARPKTWVAACAPVLLGLALAYKLSQTIHFGIALATALFSVLIQIISNLENDAAYSRRKAETGNRKGLPRATSLGLLTVAQVERVIFFLGFCVVLLTLYLMKSGGWVIVAIGIASLIGAYFYMGGTTPLAYTPYSELVCFLFYGVIAVAGTVFLQTNSFYSESLLFGAALGFLVTAVLVVNNYRDIEHDQSIHRITLAVVLKRKKTEWLYFSLVTLPYLFVVAICLENGSYTPSLLCFFALPLSVKLIRELPTKRGLDLNLILFQTAKLELFFTLLVCFGLFLSVFWFN